MLKQPVGAAAQHELGMKYDTLTTMANQIDSYTDLKMKENMRTEMTPHPVKFDMYYSC